MINWGDWQQMPDYRQFMGQRKGKSPIAQLARIADPMTHIPGIREVANPIHDAATAGIETGNRLLSPVVKGAHEITDAITPGLKQVRENVPMLQNIQRFSESNPVDTAAIIVGSIFSGGALGGAMGGAGGAAGTGAAAGAGTAAGGAAGTGSLGAAGGAAAGALKAGALSNVGANAGLMGSLKAGYAAAAPYLNALSTARSINDFAGPDMTAFGNRQQQMLLAERIRADQTNPELPNTPMDRDKKRKMVIDAMMQQPQFFGSAY